MSYNVRIVPNGARVQKAKISFLESLRIARIIVRRSLTSRRASISPKRIGRILNAMVLRRIQETNETSYALEFDQKVQAILGVVPEVMNKVIQGVPLNGQITINGETLRVTALPNDAKEITAYVKAAEFIQDLTVVQAFAQAQGIAMVAINTALPVVSPSVTMRIFSSANDQTVPFELGFSVRREAEILGSDPAEFTTPADLSLIAAQGESEDLPTVTAVPDDIGRIFVPDQGNIPVYSEIEHQFPGTDDLINSEGKAYGYLYSIFIYHPSNAEPDYLSVFIATRNKVRYDDDEDINLQVELSMSLIYSKHSASILVASAEVKVAGIVDSRSGVKQPYPSLPVTNQGYYPAQTEHNQTAQTVQVPTNYPAHHSPNGQITANNNGGTQASRPRQRGRFRGSVKANASNVLSHLSNGELRTLVYRLAKGLNGRRD